MATTVSLVLGSGGARGYAHVGVIEELRHRGYEIICIAGSSMGALVGGVYAAGCLPEYKAWVTGLGKMDIVRLLDLALTRGAIRGERLFGRIREIVGDPLIEELPIRYTAVATDIFRQKEVWFQRGSLQDAMRASSSVPGFFTPVVSGDKVLVDGGVLNPLPIIPTVAAHADLIIAVDLNAKDAALSKPWLPSGEVLDRSGFSDVWRVLNGGGSALARTRRRKVGPRTGGRIDILLDSVEVMQASLTQYKIAGYPPDVVVEIPSDLCSFYEFHRAAEVIEAGRKAASERLDQLENGS